MLQTDAFETIVWGEDYSAPKLTGEEIMACYLDSHAAISFLNDWELGLINVTLTEYRTLPAILLDARRIFKRFIDQKRKKR